MKSRPEKRIIGKTCTFRLLHKLSINLLPPVYNLEGKAIERFVTLFESCIGILILFH